MTQPPSGINHLRNQPSFSGLEIRLVYQGSCYLTKNVTAERLLTYGVQRVLMGTAVPRALSKEGLSILGLVTQHYLSYCRYGIRYLDN